MVDYQINVMDIEREIERKIVTAMRFLFTMHPRFHYDDEHRKSRVVIGIDYPENEAPLQMSQLCIGGITYTFDMGTSLGNNYLGPFYGENGVKIGDQFANIVPFSYQISCYGERNASRDLANAVVSNVTFVGRDVFEQLGVRTLRAEKGHTAPTKQFPKVFNTTVSVSSVLEWKGIIKAFDPAQLNILQKIQANILKQY